MKLWAVVRHNSRKGTMVAASIHLSEKAAIRGTLRDRNRAEREMAGIYDGKRPFFLTITGHGEARPADQALIRKWKMYEGFLSWTVDEITFQDLIDIHEAQGNHWTARFLSLFRRKNDIQG